MNFEQCRLPGRIYALWILTTLLLVSCSTSPPPAPMQGSVILPADPTLTPFQPQPSTPVNPALKPATPQVEPTYTPYPTKYFVSESLPTPVVIPSPGGEVPDFSLLNTNNPLTGLPAGDPSLLERRPMVIKVANSPDYIRPQSGLSLADVVYEYYIEWGDTRFIAVMYGNDSPLVGPVRSGRYFDEHIARMYNAFLMFKFADPREYSYLQNSTLNEFLVVPGNGPCPPYVFGPQKRDDYNNFFFDTTRWANCAARMGLDNAKQNLRGGFFTENVAQGDPSATRLYFFFSKYSYNYWEYDAATHKYFRFQEANDIVNKNSEAYAPLSDAQTGLPVTTDNIVVLFVPYTFENQFDAHDEVYHIDLVDSGSAYVFRDGFPIPAVWTRTDENQPLLLTTLTGNPVYLRPGQTFYEVIGVTSTYTQNGTDWRFVFNTP
ncbi:MAG: DUF3048 domain-containing protein [Chloroflexi bacterium]|nr:DUF3048 domain-containing protein [Chloroflexota bacterium]